MMQRRPVRMAWTFVMVMLALVPGGKAHAQEPKIRASMATKESVYVGQKATLVVELLAPGFFASAAAFDLPDPQGTLLMPPVGSPVVSSEEVDGVSYTVQRHEVAVLAQRAGDVVIPPVTVRFQFKRAPLDKDTVAAQVKTPEVRFTAMQPPGTEKLGAVISARNLEVHEAWNPDPATAKAKAGDAFTRTITFTAPDVPGMMFPPFHAATIEGIGIYAKEPEVQDHSERGSLTGQRKDVVTYALQREGTFTIPAVRFTWWDLDSKSVRVVDLPARSLTVAANPALPSVSQTSETAQGGTRGIGRKAGMAIALMLLTVLMFSVPRVRHAIGAFVHLFRPVHLQPLNPESRSQARSSSGRLPPF